MKALGTHVILDLYGCPRASLDDIDFVSRALVRSVAESGATLIKPFFHKFAPQGVSGVAIIAESHFSIHTWPEHGYAAVDVFTCGDSIDVAHAVAVLRETFQPMCVQMNHFHRGILGVEAAEANGSVLDTVVGGRAGPVSGFAARRREPVDAGFEGGKASW